MDLRPAFNSLDNPNDILELKKILSEMSDELDVLYTTTAPNGNISARQGRIALYLNGSDYEVWYNQDGLTTWVQVGGSTLRLWKVDGTETQLVTADEIDMQSKNIINLLDPVNAQDASTKNYADSGDLWEVDGTEHQLKTADEIDMQSKNIINVLDPTSAQHAATKQYVDNQVKTVCSFLARATGSGTFDETGGYDKGSDFASNTFTAPSAGRYLITYCQRFTGAANTDYSVSATITPSSGSAHKATNTWTQPDSTTRGISVIVTAILDLSQNDTVTFSLSTQETGASSAASAIYNDITQSYVTGCLIEED